MEVICLWGVYIPKFCHIFTIMGPVRLSVHRWGEIWRGGPFHWVWLRSTPSRQILPTSLQRVAPAGQTSGSAMAEGPRDALVSRKSATYKTSHLKTIVWHYLQTDGQTDGQTHDDGIYRA